MAEKKSGAAKRPSPSAEILSRLVRIELFSEFDMSETDDARILSEVCAAMSERGYKAGEVIIKEGEVGSEFYILLSGSVHISRKTPAGDSIALADLDAAMNVFFGETALVGNDERTATVSAKDDCKVLALTGRAFDALCKKEPLLGCRVFKILLRSMQQKIRQANQDRAALYEALFNEIASGGA